MSLIYRILYQVGFTPWEQIERFPAGAQIEALFAREEQGASPPFGKALELGCGSGIWSVKLASRGWDVTGVDNVPKALRRARARAADAGGVEAKLIHGDVTALGEPSVGDGFRLVLDVGCFHELSESHRAAVGRSVSAVAAPDATLLLMAWTREKRSPMYPRGATRDEIMSAFSGWRIAQEEAMDVTGAPEDVRKATPRWYTLRRE